MDKIASFQINHDTLVPGLYTSRQDGDITTYDLRMVKPNGGVYLENAALHTFEHLFATYARNSALKEHIVYCGPMGCRTGFYFLVRAVAPQDAITLVQQTLAFIAEYTGEIPGASKQECGNYLEHDLQGAKKMAAGMLPVLQDWSEARLQYPA